MDAVHSMTVRVHSHAMVMPDNKEIAEATSEALAKLVRQKIDESGMSSEIVTTFNVDVVCERDTNNPKQEKYACSKI